jgi:hypothetical protein
MIRHVSVPLLLCFLFGAMTATLAAPTAGFSTGTTLALTFAQPVYPYGTTTPVMATVRVTGETQARAGEVTIFDSQHKRIFTAHLPVKVEVQPGVYEEKYEQTFSVMLPTAPDAYSYTAESRQVNETPLLATTMVYVLKVDLHFEDGKTSTLPLHAVDQNDYPDKEIKLLHVSLTPSGIEQGVVTLSVESGDTHFRLWNDAGLNDEVPLSQTWVMSANDAAIPVSYYIEGTSVSTPDEVVLKLSYTHPCLAQPIEDTVTLTVK